MTSLYARKETHAKKSRNRMTAFDLLICFTIAATGLFLIPYSLSKTRNEPPAARVIGVTLAAISVVLIISFNITELFVRTGPYLTTLAWLATCTLCICLSVQNREIGRPPKEQIMWATACIMIAALSTGAAIMDLLSPDEQARQITSIIILAIPFLPASLLIRNAIKEHPDPSQS